MKFEGLEAFYETLADAIDRVEKKEREQFLTRLALLLANEIEEPEKALAAVEASLMSRQDAR